MTEILITLIFAVVALFPYVNWAYQQVRGGPGMYEDELQYRYQTLTLRRKYDRKRS